MTTNRTRIRALALLAVLAVAATPLSAAAATDKPDDFLVSNHESGRTRTVKPLAEIQLGNGDEIAFTPVLDSSGRTLGVMVSGVRSPDRIPTTSVAGLDDANPLELFVALAPPDVKVPALLRELYGDDADPGRQGWARDLVLTSTPTHGISCPADHVTDWRDKLDEFSTDFGDNDPFVSAWDGPTSKPEHWSAAYSWGWLGLGPIHHDLVGQANDVTAFYGSILYCYEDWENAYTFGYDETYVGNWVNSRWRVAGHGTWNQGLSEQLTEVGDLFEHLFHPANPHAPGAPSFDFQIRIEAAKPADQFHIGATWVEGRPSDFTSKD